MTNTNRAISARHHGATVLNAEDTPAPVRLGIKQMMVLKNIQHFVAAVETGSFHKAADRLGIVQSALSRRIGELEVELGGRLFERRPAGVRLTEAGQSLYDDARRMLDDLERAIRRFELIEGGQVTLLRVGINGPAMMHAALPRGLQTFRRDHSKVEVRLTPLLSQAQFTAIASGAIDLGIAFDLGQSHGLAVKRLSIDHLTLAIPADHPLATKPDLDIADLQGANFIGMERPNSGLMADLVVDQLRAANVSVRTVLEAGNTEAVLSLVAGGLGLAFINHSQSGREPPSVVLRDVARFSVPLPLCLYWSPLVETPVLTALIETIDQAFAATDLVR